MCLESVTSLCNRWGRGSVFLSAFRCEWSLLRDGGPQWCNFKPLLFCILLSIRHLSGKVQNQSSFPFMSSTGSCWSSSGSALFKAGCFLPVVCNNLSSSLQGYSQRLVTLLRVILKISWIISISYLSWYVSKSVIKYNSLKVVIKHNIE